MLKHEFLGRFKLMKKLVANFVMLVAVCYQICGPLGEGQLTIEVGVFGRMGRRELSEITKYYFTLIIPISAIINISGEKL